MLDWGGVERLERGGAGLLEIGVELEYGDVALLDCEGVIGWLE